MLFRGYLRKQKLRLTRERMDLLRAALGAPSHFDADGLASSLRKQGRKVSRATTYRTLTLLEQCGILRKSLQREGRSLYETALDRGHHDHILCLSCGRIEEFFDERVEKLQDEIASGLGFRVVNHLHELLGFCGQCARRDKADGKGKEKS
ncbi:MAG: transcriptional repressor [Candidatus Eisenbacteria bacterium]|nr:transcriptional repressor [Candidatus Eisenbacteria bacterium]